MDRLDKQFINNKHDITILEYVLEVNKIKYKIEKEFIDDFIELITRNDCCIHHTLLQKYGILTSVKPNDIKRLMEQHEFIDNEDYHVRNLVQLEQQTGLVYKNEFYIHPRAFKICLCRSLKSKKYARYCLILEEYVKYYHIYQHKIKDNYINDLTLRDEKLDKIIHVHNQLNIVIAKLNTKLDDIAFLITLLFIVVLGLSFYIVKYV
jgi:hypothetical protein